MTDISADDPRWFASEGLASTATWLVYGVMRPDTREVIYIGITQNLKRRLAQHKASNQSPVNEIFKFFDGRGHPMKYCIFGEFASETAARHLEKALIIAMPRPFNATHFAEGHKFWQKTKAVEQEAALAFQGQWKTGYDPTIEGRAAPHLR